MHERVRAVRDAIRERGSGDAWRPIYELAVRDAYAGMQLGIVARLSAIAAAQLVGQGRPEDALAELSFGLRLANDDDIASADLLLVRAGHEMFGATPRTALASIEEARRRHPRADTEPTASEMRGRAATARCIALDPALSAREAEDAIAGALSHQLDGVASVATGWFVTWLIAHGALTEATPWLESMELQAEQERQRWRVAETRLLRWVIQVACGQHGRAPRWEPLGHAATPDRFRAGVLTYLAGMHGRPTPEPRGRRTEGGPLNASDDDGYAAALRAQSSGALDVELAPPSAPTLLNLGRQLASAEAVAIGGTQRDALAWRDWIGELPAGIECAVDWPASVRRIHGLLAARCGEFRVAVRLLTSAREWATSSGFPVEGAAAALQLASVMAVAPEPYPRIAWQEMRDAGIEEARALGLDERAIAHAATLAAAAGKFDVSRPPLTPREIEVLSQFANGLTYQETAARIAVSRRTVQSHAYNAYAKLGVHNKLAAINRAQDLGLI